MSESERVRVHIDLDWPQRRTSLELATSGPGKTDRVHLPPELARGTVSLVSVSPGLAYLEGQFTIAGVPGQGRVHTAQPCFQFVVHRTHTPARILWDSTSRAIRFGYQNAIILGPDSCPTRVFAPDEQVDEISLLVNASCIESIVRRLDCPLDEAFASALTHTEPTSFRSSGITTTEMRHSLDALTGCSLTGSFRRLYQEARIHEILAICLAQFASPSCTDRDVFLLQHDLELLEQAHDIILERITSPPTIADLAQLVGLNQTKLKAGFKKFYGTTIFGFIRLTRMQHALRLLSSGQYNVGEAAAELGYRSTGAFTRAFQAEFGCNPGSIRGKELEWPEAVDSVLIESKAPG